MVAAPRNVVYVQGPFYDPNSKTPFPNNQTANRYFNPVLALKDTIFILCFGHFNNKADYQDHGWGLVINNVAATDPSVDKAMAPVKTATAAGATVLLSIGGWDNPEDWANIVENPALCAQQVADFLNAYGLKGIDIDNEDIADRGDVVGTFITELAGKVEGLIVSCSPMETQMTAQGFYSELVASPASQYIQWYNIQYYQDCTSFYYETFMGEFTEDVNAIAGWYGGKLESPGNYAVIGAAPMQCGLESPAMAAALAAQLEKNNVAFGGFAWWNYPAMSPPNLEEEVWGQHLQEEAAPEEPAQA